MRRIVFLLIATFLFAACESSSSNYPDPNLSPDEVLTAVTEYVADRGTQLGDYDLDRIAFDYASRRWSVGFSGKSGIVGDHFWVIVSDQNISEISLVPGL
jgi:hypothetical protein